MNDDPARAARELLAFYAEAGVDTLIDETPANRLADAFAETASSPGAEPAPANMPDPSGPEFAGAAPARTVAASEPHARPMRERAPDAPAQTVVPRTATPSTEAAVMAAREAARSAETLEALRAIMQAFEGCALKTMAKRLVFADGNPQARAMFVGEAPGREEDIEGLPFVGRSGQLLDRMLAAISLDRRAVYIANIIPWRPPGNRTPTPQEAAICMPFIQRQIELVDPDLLVCLGKPATALLLGLNDSMRKLRGRWTAYRTGRREIRALVTYHPAYLLRSPLDKRSAWRDFLAIKRALAE